jgi:hypothetical protein
MAVNEAGAHKGLPYGLIAIAERISVNEKEGTRPSPTDTFEGSRDNINIERRRRV